MRAGKIELKFKIQYLCARARANNNLDDEPAGIRVSGTE